METYNIEDLSFVLRVMASYLDGCTESETQGYFQEIVNTGLFHDAMGKVVSQSESEVVVTTDY